MGTINYTVSVGGKESGNHTEVITREDALATIADVKKMYCPESNNVFFLNGNIKLDMKGRKYSIHGEFIHIPQLQ